MTPDRRQFLGELGIAGAAVGVCGLAGITMSPLTGAAMADAGPPKPKPIHPRLKKTKIPWKEKFDPKTNLKDLLDSLDLDQSKREVVVSAFTYALRELGYEMVEEGGIEEQKIFGILGGVLTRFHMKTLPKIEDMFEKKKGKSGVLEESGVEGF